MRTFANVLLVAGALMTLYVLVAALVGCGASQQQRQLCYAQNEAHAFERRERECPPGGDAWAECSARPAILEELKQRHAACP